MSEVALRDSSGDEVEVAAEFLEIPAAQVLELVKLRALESRIERGRELIRIEELRASTRRARDVAGPRPRSSAT